MSIRYNRDLRYRKSRNKKQNRPKTFKTPEAAKKYAESKGIKNYTLRNTKSADAKSKKIKIIIK